MIVTEERPPPRIAVCFANCSVDGLRRQNPAATAPRSLFGQVHVAAEAGIALDSVHDPSANPEVAGLTRKELLLARRCRRLPFTAFFAVRYWHAFASHGSQVRRGNGILFVQLKAALCSTSYSTLATPANTQSFAMEEISFQIGTGQL